MLYRDGAARHHQSPRLYTMAVALLLNLWASSLQGASSAVVDPKETLGTVKMRPTIELNVMVVGQSGTGKTSCINSIFDDQVIPKKGAIMSSTRQMTIYRRLFVLKNADMDLVST